MIISVHIPRTAGSSFRAYLRRNPNIRLLEDYGNPILVPRAVSRTYAALGRVREMFKGVPDDVDCLHGHFLPYKYKYLLNSNDVRFITWLRDPIDRLRSQYDYCFESNKKVDKSPFQNKVAREQWTFEAFARHPYIKNIYTRIFWQFPIDAFDFIGIVEHFESDFKYICEHYFNDYDPTLVYGNQTLGHKTSEVDVEQLRDWHRRDFKLYEYALEKRRKRVHTV